MIQSSMKYFDLSSLTEDEIIEKYESLLAGREKQIKELSHQIGLLNEKYYDNLDEIKTLEKEMKESEEKCLKKENILNQEINSREIMKKQIDEYVKINQDLRKQIENNVSKNSSDEVKNFFRANSLNNNNNNNINNNDNNINNNNDNNNINNNNKETSPKKKKKKNENEKNTE